MLNNTACRLSMLITTPTTGLNVPKEWNGSLRGGICCTMCFDMRFERTALYAAENGFSVISSSLGISPLEKYAAG